MNRAYWNEPLPLNQEYPESPCGLNGVEITGIFFTFLSVFSLLPSAKDWPGPGWIFGVGIAGLALFMFWLGPKVARYNYNKVWKTAFQRNNADLKLFYPAIDMVIKHLAKNTTYAHVNFENVAMNLACSLRKSTPFAENEHTTFSWEVLHAYFHFKDASRPLIITACPKPTADTTY